MNRASKAAEISSTSFILWFMSAATAPTTTLTGSRCRLPDGSCHCPRPSSTVKPARKRGVMVSARNCYHSVLGDGLSRAIGQPEEELEFAYWFQSLRAFLSGTGRARGYSHRKRDEKSGQRSFNI